VILFLGFKFSECKFLMNDGAAAGVTFFGTADRSQKVTPITPETSDEDIAPHLVNGRFKTEACFVDLVSRKSKC